MLELLIILYVVYLKICIDFMGRLQSNSISRSLPIIDHVSVQYYCITSNTDTRWIIRHIKCQMFVARIDVFQFSTKIVIQNEIYQFNCLTFYKCSYIQHTPCQVVSTKIQLNKQKHIFEQWWVVDTCLINNAGFL